MRLDIPTITLNSKKEHIEYLLSRINRDTYIKEKLLLSFKGCKFITPEAVNILAGLKYFRDIYNLKTEIDIKSLDSKVYSYFKKCHFFKIFGINKFYKKRTSAIPIYNQKGRVDNDFMEFINSEILDRSDMPDIANQFKKGIRVSFLEIISNIKNHSESSIGGFLCGQVYPNEEQIQIAFYDPGVGIAEKVKSCNEKISRDPEAILWALGKGNSTSSNENSPRGMGLFVLREFLKKNGGELRIYANNGFWKEEQGNSTIDYLKHSLKGTSIDLIINIGNDESHY